MKKEDLKVGMIIEKIKKPSNSIHYEDLEIIFLSSRTTLTRGVASKAEYPLSPVDLYLWQPKKEPRKLYAYVDACREIRFCKMELSEDDRPAAFIRAQEYDIEYDE